MCLLFSKESISISTLFGNMEPFVILRPSNKTFKPAVDCVLCHFLDGYHACSRTYGGKMKQSNGSCLAKGSCAWPVWNQMKIIPGNKFIKYKCTWTSIYYIQNYFCPVYFFFTFCTCRRFWPVLNLLKHSRVKRDKRKKPSFA